jgi:hypothetical protein
LTFWYLAFTITYYGFNFITQTGGANCIHNPHFSLRVLCKGMFSKSCREKVSTKSNPKSTSSAYPPWPATTGPAGFHIVGYSSGEYVWLGVVGSANNNCQTIANNQNKYRAYGALGNGILSGTTSIMSPDYVNSSTSQFYLLGSEDPLCGVTSPSHFRLSFYSTWATNGPGSFGRKLETSYSMIFLFDSSCQENCKC